MLQADSAGSVCSVRSFDHSPDIICGSLIPPTRFQFWICIVKWLKHIDQNRVDYPSHRFVVSSVLLWRTSLFDLGEGVHHLIFEFNH